MIPAEGLLHFACQRYTNHRGCRASCPLSKQDMKWLKSQQFRSALRKSFWIALWKGLSCPNSRFSVRDVNPNFCQISFIIVQRRIILCLYVRLTLSPTTVLLCSIHMAASSQEMILHPYNFHRVYHHI